MRLGVRAGVIAGIGSLIFGSLSIPVPAAASTRSIATITPSLINVSPGGTQDSLTVTYKPLDPQSLNESENSIYLYELSLDSQTWWPCVSPTPEQIIAGEATCNLSNLKPLQTYGVYFRVVLGQELLPGSVTTLAVSRVAGPVIATTQIPQSLDPDKPAKLPSPRQNVNAKFNAASNSLGVDATKRSVGVGTLPRLTFSQNIVNKAAVERHLVVSAQYPNGSIRPVAGAWGWTSEKSVVFRPRDYWPGNSTIRIVADLSRVVLGKSGGKSLVGSKSMNTTYQFKTARKFVARVDGATKKMKVYIDGKKVQTFPVSLGKNAWETRNGTKVVSTAKEPNKIYRSESLGLTAPEDQYELAAPWNTRLTPTGEFIHAAPWAYGRLGRFNGSHGCTNMYTADAEWFYKNTIPGDVVFYTNTGGSNMEPWNGPGGLWNVPWSTWIKKSAIASGTNSIDTNVNAGTGSLAAAKPASA